MDRPEIFFQRFYGRGYCFGSVFKVGDVAPSDPFGFFLGGRQYVQRAILFRSTTIALIEELPISSPVMMLRAI